MKKPRLVLFGVAAVTCVFAVTASLAFAQRDKPQALRTLTWEERRRAFPNNAHAVLENAGRFTLYATSPTQRTHARKRFHRYGVLGKMIVADPALKKQLLAALDDGIAEAQRPPQHGLLAPCFKPRHGIRAVDRNGRVVDLVICFECGNARMYADKHKTTFAITETPQALFNRVLKTKGIRTAP